MPSVRSSSPILALVFIIFGHFLNHFYAYVFGAAMFVIRADIAMSNQQIGLLATIQMSTFALFTFAVGIIGDKWVPSKKLFVPLGVFLMALHLVVAANAQSFVSLVLVAVIVGFGSAFYHPVAYSMIAELYEDKKGISMALNAALGMIGTALTPGLVGTFNRLIGWRKFFLFFGLGAVGISLILFYCFNRFFNYKITKKEHELVEQREDMTNGQRVSHWFRTELIMILTLLVVICLLYSSFRSGLYKIITQFLSIIFVDYLNYNIFQAGWISSIMLIIGGLTAIGGGFLSDKYPTSLTMVISLLGSAVSILFIWLLGGILPGFWIIGLFFLFVAFLHFSSAASTKYVAESVPKHSRSTALGFLFAIPSSIAGVFPWLFGLILDKTTFEVSFLYLFSIAAIATLLAFVLLVKDIKRGKFGFVNEEEKKLQLKYI